MSDLELENSCLSSNSDTASNASDTDATSFPGSSLYFERKDHGNEVDTDENMDFRENTDSENDTEVKRVYVELSLSLPRGIPLTGKIVWR